MSGHDPPGASTAMSLEVRPYRDGDAEGLAALVLDIRQGKFGISITYADQPDPQDVAGFFRNRAGEFWVAVDGTDVVGCVGFGNEPLSVDARKRHTVTKPIWRILMHTLTARSGASGIASPRLILREARRQNRKNG